MNALLVVIAFFIMSLIAAFVLFRWLKNTALVKLPLGQFGGAIAGFIIVFILLNQSYINLKKTPQKIKLDTPTNFKTFISEDYKIGFGYPKNLKFEVPGALTPLASFEITEATDASIFFGASSFKNFDLEKEGIDKIRRERVESSINGLKTMFPNLEIVKVSDKAIKGIKGHLLEGLWQLGSKRYKVFMILIPNFDINMLYLFTLTTTEVETEKNLALFMEVVSTIEFLK